MPGFERAVFVAVRHHLNNYSESHFIVHHKCFLGSLGEMSSVLHTVKKKSIVEGAEGFYLHVHSRVGARQAARE